MKKKYIFLFLVIVIPVLNSFSQQTIEKQNSGKAEGFYLGERISILPSTIDQLKKTALIYRYHLDSLLIELNTNKKCKNDSCIKNSERAEKFKKLISSSKINLDEVQKRRNELHEEVFYNNQMLNLLFANEVTTYANNASDLSLNKYYAGLDSDDSSLSFSINFNPRGEEKLKSLKWFFSTGFKAKSEEKFATIFKNGKFENSDLAVSGKVTLIGLGTINFGSKKRQKQSLESLAPNAKPKPVFNKTEIIRNFRRELLKNYEDKIAQYSTTQFPQQLDSLKLLYNKKYNETKDVQTKTKELIASKYEEFYEKIATDEITYMKKNKLYNFLTSHWITFDFNAPIGQKKYDTAATLEDATTKAIKFYAFKCNLTGTKFWKFSNKQSIYLTARLSVFNNNNILAEEIEPSTFQTIYNQSPTQQAVVAENENVYVLASGYKNFATGSIKFEPIYFILDWLGLSASAEKNFGQYYHPMNWKIGIPLSLKDKDGKASVNLEPQYKKINNNELYGISVSFFLGKFLN